MLDNKTVLIVDDSNVSRMMIKSIIEDTHPDWNIIEASNGNEALDKAVSHPIDLMILDFNMPGMDGLELGENLRKQYPKAKISLLTANVQSSIKHRASDLGISFTGKPITEARIHSMLETLDN